MTTDEQILWAKISGFQLDQEESSFSFSDRVARENGWSKKYTLRVIDEYKKFIYLCCVSEDGITPSDPVDQVWHLHLTYTRSYWIEFCQETLGKSIHHNPTKGGDKEARKFNNYYSRLKDVYRYHFDSDPPTDIWPSNETRFSDIDFQRVNLKRFWLIRKPTKRLYSIFTLAIISLPAILSIQAIGASFKIGVIIIVASIAGYYVITNWIWGDKKKRKKDNSGGCSGCGNCSGTSSGYYADSGSHSHGGSHHSGNSGCSSGCSGCSGSGCSGCGGGGD